MRATSAYQTAFSRTGTRDMQNRKPYRTAAQKAAARANAVQVNGTWVANAPVSYHRAPRKGGK